MILPFLLKRGSALGAHKAQVLVAEKNQTAIVCLSKCRFDKVRRFLEFYVNLDDVAEIPVKSSGYMCHIKDGEEKRLARLQNEAFSGSWGFKPNSEHEIRYYLELTNSTLNDILLFEKNGKLAGYIWFNFLAGRPSLVSSNKARIHMFGIHPQFRRKGLGRLLLLEGLTHLQKLGFGMVELTVDSRNKTAFSLYTSLGFRVIKEYLWYERPL